MRLIDSIVRQIAMRTGRLRWLFRRKASNADWGAFTKRWGGLHACGQYVAINVGCRITDPYLVSIGNNVTLADCTILGHDASVEVIGRALSLRLESVGPVVILDNCFVGHGAIILPNVKVGPNCIVAAGAVVTRDAPPDSVVGGVPAKTIGKFSELAQKLHRETEALPWAEVIKHRVGAFDATLEPHLREQRTKHFFSGNA